jgi:hypothetical protein
MTSVDPSEFESASRNDLIARAEALGIEKADVLTRVELIDEIVKRTIADPIERRLARGLLGAARDLVARVVERGLHLPDAAALIRGLQHVALNPGTTPIATVTLAEIYAGQGHRDRALAVLNEVLRQEPDHVAARKLREKVASIDDDQIATIAPPEAEIAPSAAVATDGATEQDRAEAEDDRDVFAPDVSDAMPTIAAPPRSAEISDAIEADSAPGGSAIDAVERDLQKPGVELAAYLATDDDLAGPETPRDWALPVTDAPPEAVDALSAAPIADSDELVLASIDATSALACWELHRDAVRAARDRAPGGALILRVVAVTPSWDGPVSEVRDVEIEGSSGDFWIGDLPVHAVLRGAIGWRGERGFDPLAVALGVLDREDDDVVSDDRRTIPIPDSMPSAQRRLPIERRARSRAHETPGDRGPSSSSWRALAVAPWEPPYVPSPMTSLEPS